MFLAIFIVTDFFALIIIDTTLSQFKAICKITLRFKSPKPNKRPQLKSLGEAIETKELASLERLGI